jgi:hypothetical protein
MQCFLGCKWPGVISGVLGVLFLVTSASAENRPDHPYRYSDVDMPVSLAPGTVRTPEFSVVKHWYWIMIQVEKPLPFLPTVCMMGVTMGPLQSKDCDSDDPLLRTDWTVWDEGRLIASGSSTTEGSAAYTNKNIFKFLGGFMGQAGKKYVVEVKFTKDGTPLNAAHPHLIITKQGKE